MLPLNEVQVRRGRHGVLYRIIPQEILSGQSIRVALSLVEEGRFVASKTQEILSNVDYRIENTRIKISVDKFRDEEEFYVAVQAPGYDIVKEAQPLSTSKYY